MTMHFDLSLVGLIRVALTEDVTLRLDGEHRGTSYRRHEVVNLPKIAGELLVRSGKAVAA